MSGRSRMIQAQVPRCASWVHSGRGSVRAIMPSPTWRTASSSANNLGSSVSMAFLHSKRERSGLAGTLPSKGQLWLGSGRGDDRFLGLLNGARLGFRRGGEHAGVDMGREAREIVVEQFHQPGRGRVIFGLVGPGLARLEDL